GMYPGRQGTRSPGECSSRERDHDHAFPDPELRQCCCRSGPIGSDHRPGCREQVGEQVGKPRRESRTRTWFPRLRPRLWPRLRPRLPRLRPRLLPALLLRRISLAPLAPPPPALLVVLLPILIVWSATTAIDEQPRQRSRCRGCSVTGEVRSAFP